MHKRENYQPTDFRSFYITKPLWLGDFRALIFFNFRGSFRSEKFLMHMLSMFLKGIFFVS